MKDWRGNDYGVGSKIIYPATMASSAEMVEAEVLEVLPPSKNSWGVGRPTRLKVQPIRRSRFGWHDETKPVVLSVLKNVTVI